VDSVSYCFAWENIISSLTTLRPSAISGARTMAAAAATANRKRNHFGTCLMLGPPSVGIPPSQALRLRHS
jgi:hypothetical protein